ncbi:MULTISPECIES: pyrroloquinoline-quinone synthase PqqC [unclassified Methylibium]|uniref:pyrroloquinoline-quinone synthase PqqC n=1 Tax=unclassified Methylibium TaxID=2633235 RepID=UPI0003F46013|nr:MULTISPECIES: pyrroloquinoline-quinone synthase PqqC [unclassified Methylibium]EWS52994.1 Pyrroloquinoline-quinone synthase [Methylibium sp. T29]EWS57895.1 Pyrroloquinoline-quinone synthase [Methylibium sp. T29-B]
MSADLPWSPAEFEARLRAKESGYHIHHPFNKRLNSGALQPFQVRGWVANRFYYQQAIPMKDAAVMANCEDRATRRRWIERMLDHDGHLDHEGQYSEKTAGGIETWTRLGMAVGLSREDLWSHRHVQPGVRFAVDAYVNFARRAPWREGVISSLTEMFAPKIHADRLAGWPSMYPWIAAEGLAYFRSRIPLAQRDVEHGLEVAIAFGDTRAKQERAIEILQFKLDVLWSLLDAVERAYPDDLPEERRP